MQRVLEREKGAGRLGRIKGDVHCAAVVIGVIVASTGVIIVGSPAHKLLVQHRGKRGCYVMIDQNNYSPLLVPLRNVPLLSRGFIPTLVI